MNQNTQHYQDLGKGKHLSEGFLDMQVNGFKGHDYSSEDFNPASIREIIFELAKSGTAKHVPTIVTSPQDRIIKNIKKIVGARKSDPLIEAAIVGIHIEGPYISPDDGPRGAHDPEFVRLPDINEIIQWNEASEGLLKVITIAPELPGAIECIKEISNLGIVAAIGHTAAEPEDIEAAVQAGARLSTHLGNGSHGTVPRLRNYIWEQLGEDSLYAGIISDGFHLPQSVVKTIARTKGLERLILVSDVALLGGFPPGTYKWGNLDVEVFEDGHLGLPGTPFLAGAAHLLDWNIAHFIRFTNCSLQETIKLCTSNPKGLLNVDPGKVSSVEFEFTYGEDRLRILKTTLDNTVLYEL
jgi:N-acetylglucosamine-6-phosphate deacetylase